MSYYRYAIIAWKDTDPPEILEFSNTATEAEDQRLVWLRRIVTGALSSDVYDVTVESGDFDPKHW